jgi:hypothetical protein
LTKGSASRAMTSRTGVCNLNNAQLCAYGIASLDYVADIRR